jgi:DNA adenine methylase
MLLADSFTHGTTEPPTQMKPFLRWAGSKRKLLPQIRRFWKPTYARYVEPFMGSACLYFALNPRRAILNDINQDLVDAFLQIKNHPRAVFNRLQTIPKGKRSYYRLRKQHAIRNPIDRAARFVFLNRFCFNGIYRTNENGEFNVPFAPEGTGDLPTWTELKDYAQRLGSARIYCEDFETILDRTQEGDFVYLDPPFAMDNRRIFRQYGPQTFGLQDIGRLNNALRRMHRRQVRFVLSYAYCPEAVAHFSNWSITKVRTRRNVAGFSGHRRHAFEILAANHDLEVEHAN